MRQSTLIEEPFVGNVEFADLNQDGYLDLVLCRSLDPRQYNHRAGSRVRIRFGGPHGFFDRPPIELPANGGLDLIVADLNHDGSLDIGVAQYSGGLRTDLPFVIFWNQGGGTFDTENRLELPATGASAALAAHLDDDQLVDLLVVNHILSGNHNTNSYIYWGSPQGFSAQERTALPGVGPHWLQNVDVGNLYTRKLEETYMSTPIAVPQELTKLRILLQAETPLQSGIEVQVRSARRQEALLQQPWRAAGNSAIKWIVGDTWLQYRLIFRTGKGGATPYLSEVAIQEVE
jgi:hypothetical protein